MKTLRNPVSRVSSLLVAAAISLAHVAAAHAGTVRGTVKMPDASRSTRLYHGYWRLENGNVPVQTAGGAKAETVVVLENVKGAHAPSARTITIELGGLAFSLSAGESLHTENSYKYAPGDFERIAHDHDFDVQRSWGAMESTPQTAFRIYMLRYTR